MNRRNLTTILWILLFTNPGAWAEGTKGHSLVNGKAVEALALLPVSADGAALAAFYARYRPYLEAHASDLNQIRVFDLSERPKHFIDLDSYDAQPPFRDIPHTWSGAVTQYGLAKMATNGTLPWIITDHYKLLVNAYRTRDLPGILDESAAMGTLVGELHQPFHVTSNYNGLKTGQYGIHDRFETRLVADKLDAATVKPDPPVQLPSPTEALFVWAGQAYTQVAPILAADKAATATDKNYGASYYTAFAVEALPIARRQLTQAATDLASLYYTAWVQAGRPALPADINPTRSEKETNRP